MNELHLFAGCGGGILGGILLGHTTVCAVELDAYCRKVLLQRQRDGILPRFPIWDDVTTFDGKPWRGRVDIVAGGFPCKGISVAGTGTGLDHEESGLWREQYRIIGDVRPPFVFVENSPALTVRGGLRVIGDLAALGYDCRWGVISAADAIWSYGVPCLDHERARIWILGSDGNAHLGRCERADAVEKFYHHQDWTRPSCEQSWNPIAGTFEPASETASDDNCFRRDMRGFERQGIQRPEQARDEVDPSREASADLDCGRKLQPQRRQRDERRRTGHCRENFDAARSNAAKFTQRKPADEIDTITVERNPRTFTLRSGQQDVGGGTSADADIAGFEMQRQPIADGTRLTEQRSWWAAEPGVGRMVNGLAHRVDRLKAIGNGQVSAVVKLAFDTLK